MRYKVIVAYEGTKYAGWQKQENANSVQITIEKVLSSICNESIDIVASGRTDAQVHAIAQVFHFDTNLDLPSDKWRHAINGYLPKDIRIIEIEQVSSDFHARFDATKKTYIYKVSTNMLDPFTMRYALHIPYAVDLIRMKECMKVIEGTHDFTSFSSSKIHPEKSRVKTIRSFTLKETEDGFIFRIEGDGFLRYMVRMLVQTMLEVGRGNETIESVKDMLDHPSKHKCKYKAEAQGLYLQAVEYGGQHEKS